MQKIYLLYIFFITLAPAIYAHSTQFSIFNAIQLVSGNATYRIIPSKDNKYGYEIFVNNKLMKHQPNIPGMLGNIGFTRKNNVKKSDSLVIKKIATRHNLLLEKKRLDSLKFNLYGIEIHGS